jgi:hypothetical protein
MVIGIMVLIGIIIAMGAMLRHYIAESRIAKRNLEIELRGEYERQQELTVKQLKEGFKEELETLKEHGVRAKDVGYIVKARYNYIDSVRVRDTLVWAYDTIRDDMVASFDVRHGCDRITGTLYYDTITIETIERDDEIMVTLYKEKRKCMFKAREYKAICTSKCTGETMGILRNIKVRR